MEKLNYFIKKDLRIKKVYDYVKEGYNKANLTQHNFEHILRVLYRALLIADAEKDVDYSILIPAALLHDIGITEKGYKEHERNGPPIIRRDLIKFGYSKEEIEEICHCVETHKTMSVEGKIYEPKTKEAKVINDADTLEKSGLTSTFFAGRVQYELGMPIDEFVNRVIKLREEKVKSGFYTKKAEEIDNDGLKERLELFKKMNEELKTRKDFLVNENDLWEEQQNDSK